MNARKAMTNNNPSGVLALYGRREQAAQFGLLLIAISYSLVVLSSPLPSTPGLIEVVIGIGLLVGTLLVLVNGEILFTGWLKIAVASQIFMLAYGCVAGMLYSNTLSNILRDIIPHIYIVTPALLVSVTGTELRKYALKYFTVSVILVGIVSSMQFLYGIHNHFGAFSSFTHMMMVGYHGGVLGVPMSEGELNIIAAIFKKNYDPSILFATIVLLGWGVMNTINSRSRVYGAMLILLGACLGYGIFLLGLRAHAAIVVCALILYVLYLIRRMPPRNWMWAAVLGAAIMIPIFSTDLLQVMLAKQALVGSNGKITEFISVWNHITIDVNKITLGYGWGASFGNPILNSDTRFTHSIISYYLLKTGIIGIALSVLTLICILPTSTPRIIKESHIIMLLGIASMAALSVCLLQPTYKMLSFGILLAIVAMLTRADEDTCHYLLSTSHNNSSMS